MEHIYLSTQQVADLLGVSPRTVTRWREAEGLSAINVGRQIRFRAADVDEWIASRPVTPRKIVKREVLS